MAGKAVTGKRTLARGVMTLLALAGLAAATLVPSFSSASSHREAPLTAADPQVDNTDVYAFTSPDNPSTVTFITNFIPFEEPAGGPNFYAFGKGVAYDINIDNNADAKPDVIYRWKFKDHYRTPGQFLYNTNQVTSLTDPDLNFYQTYTLKRIVPGGSSNTLVSDAIAAPSDVGDASMPDYGSLRNEAIKTFGGSAKTFAGQVDDPFFVDLRIFDLLYGGDFSEVGDDTLQGFNVNTIALQVPKTDVAKSGDPGTNNIIGVWSTASRRATRVEDASGSVRSSGDLVQVSRLGNPLVNEAAIPVSLKDKWNGSKPAADGQFLPYVQDPIVPKVVQAVYGLAPPDSDPDAPGIQRADLISVLLTGVDGLNKPKNVTPSEELRLNLSTPPCESGTCDKYSPLGVIGGDVAGYPNGRRLADDVIDIDLQVFEGELIGNPNNLGDGVDQNDRTFSSTFPYVALPHSGSNASPH